MGDPISERTREAWTLVRSQHGVVTRAQLLGAGFAPKAIKHRIAVGRLHVLHPGVYAVGRPELTRHGRWMAAVLACGGRAALSHFSAAALLRIRSWHVGPIEVSLPPPADRRPQGLVVHQRTGLRAEDVTRSHGIPVTTVACTLVDIASRLTPDELEGAINEADRLELIDPDRLRRVLEDMPRRPGIGLLRRTLDRRTFTLTDSRLERLFLALARDARLPRPVTGARLNGFEVDFYWPDLGLVVETDGLRYHRTPAQQARDRLRDQAHTVAGLTPLRFTRAQVRFEPGYVRETLRRVARRLGMPADSRAPSDNGENRGRGL